MSDRKALARAIAPRAKPRFVEIEPEPGPKVLTERITFGVVSLTRNPRDVQRAGGSNALDLVPPVRRQKRDPRLTGFSPALPSVTLHRT
jgi:hypothetical protein